MSSRRTFIMQVSSLAVAGEAVASRATLASTESPSATMKTQKLPGTDLIVSRIAYGAGYLAEWNNQPLDAQALAKAERVIHTAYDNGITFFDHADMYASGKCESAFGEVLRRSKGFRNKIVIQTKCGICFTPDAAPGQTICLDFSREHIVHAVEGSLRRLNTDYLDILLLHWPDPLAQPDEVADAVVHLKHSGKVRHFGVSNYAPSQISLLQSRLRERLVVNQIHVGLGYPAPIAGGLTKLWLGEAIPQDGTIDFCREHDMQIQAYSPLRSQLLNPPADAPAAVKNVAKALADIATKKESNPSAVALAWLLRHPANIIPVIGATNPEHIIDNCKANDVRLSVEEWYTLLIAACAAQTS